VGLLAGVGSNVASLVLETVEGLVAERALVGTGQVLSRLFLGGLLGSVLEERSHEAHGAGSHGRVLVDGGRGLGSGCVWVEEVGKAWVGGRW